MKFEDIIDSIVRWISTEGVKLGIGIIVVFIIFKLINFLSRKIERRLEKKQVDKLIQNALVNVFRKVAKGFVLLVFLGFLGVETSSIAAGITSLGVALGLALQGSLSNLAGGLILLFTRPFKIGDFIESNEVSGTVESIGIYFTNIVAPDNKEILIPNGALANGVIINYTAKGTRRLDMTFSIAYENDFNKAKDLILKCVTSTEKVFDSPKPFVNITKHNTSSLDILARFWLEGKNYWDVYYELLEEVRIEFDANGILVPYDKIDVKIKKND